MTTCHVLSTLAQVSKWGIRKSRAKWDKGASRHLWEQIEFILSQVWSQACTLKCWRATSPISAEGLNTSGSWGLRGVNYKGIVYTSYMTCYCRLNLRWTKESVLGRKAIEWTTTQKLGVWVMSPKGRRNRVIYKSRVAARYEILFHRLWESYRLAYEQAIAAMAP